MKKYCVISHTHWDREWYLPFEKFRFKLVALIDSLLEIIQKDKSYIFHLDAQTVVLEDYLQIRKNKKEELFSAINSGNIVIGPWYLQNDFILTSGEALIRNLLKGRDICSHFDKKSNVGYAPDQFGNISQLPQILNDFGIDTFVFGRGYKFYVPCEWGFREERRKTHFNWIGPDGSNLLAVNLINWYNNTQRFPRNIEHAKVLVDYAEKKLSDATNVPYYLFMNGVDHLEPQDDINLILKSLREKYDYDIRQYTLDEYMDEIKKYSKTNKLESFTGPLIYGDDYFMLRGCWSTRIFVKQANVKAQDMLESVLEPLFTYIKKQGIEYYDYDYLDYLWTTLLKNHPHDTICSCSVDPVIRHTMDSFERINEASSMLLNEAMKVASTHFIEENDNDYSITLFNPSIRKHKEVVSLFLDFPKTEEVNNFTIKDLNGNSIDYIVVNKKDFVKDVYSPLNLPGTILCDRYDVRFEIELDAISMYQLIVSKAENEYKKISNNKFNFIENDYYKISYDKKHLVLKNKKTNSNINDFITFTYQCDCGDTYVEEPIGEVVSSSLLSFEVIEDSMYLKKAKLVFEINCNKKFNYDKLTPSDEIIKNEITTFITLKTDDVISVDYCLDNKVKDQILKVKIKHGVLKPLFYSDSAFDLFERNDNEFTPVNKTHTHSMATFCFAKDDKNQCSIFSKGQHEFEKFDDSIALTILRCNNYISRVEHHKESGGDLWRVPENENLIHIEGSFAFTYSMLTNGEAYTRAREYRSPFVTFFNSLNDKKFTGGRSVVQDVEASVINQNYYKAKISPAVKIDCKPIVSIDNPNIVLSSLRYNNNNIFIRLFNITDEIQTVNIKYGGCIYYSNLREDISEKIDSKITVGKKKIITLCLK